MRNLLKTLILITTMFFVFSRVAETQVNIVPQLYTAGNKSGSISLTESNTDGTSTISGISSTPGVSDLAIDFNDATTNYRLYRTAFGVLYRHEVDPNMSIDGGTAINITPAIDQLLGFVDVDPVTRLVYVFGRINSGDPNSIIVIDSNGARQASDEINTGMIDIAVDPYGSNRRVYWTAPPSTTPGFYYQPLPINSGDMETFVDIITASATPIHSITGAFDIDPINERLYFVGRITNTDTTNSVIVTDFSGTVLSSFAITGGVSDLAFDPLNEVLYRLNGSDIYVHDIATSSESMIVLDDTPTATQPFQIDVGYNETFITVEFVSATASNAESVAAPNLLSITTSDGNVTENDMTVDVAITGAGTLNSDYTLTSTTVTIPAGTASGSTIPIPGFGVIDDSLVEVNEVLNMTLSNAIDGYLGTQTTLDYAIIDNEVAAFTIVESSGSTQTTEAGMNDSFTVVLDAQPTNDVVLTISSGDTSEGTVNSPLTFTNANWDTPQTVNVTHVNENIVDGNITYNVTISVDDSNSDDAYDPVADQTVSVTNVDNDVAGFTIVESGGTTQTTEAGMNDSFTVVLDSQPLTDVVLLVSSGDTSEGTVNTPLTFTNANWDTTQTVNVTRVDDDVDDGNITYNVTVSVDGTNSDSTYVSVSNQTVSVTNVDDDVAGFTIVESGGTTQTTEAGMNDSFTVVLDAQPLTDVVLLVSSGDTSEGTVNTPLTFTNANWNTPQTVNVTHIDENIDDGNITYNVTVSVDGTNSDSTYTLVSSQTVSVTNVDDDTAGVTIDVNTVQVTEGGTTETITVNLNTVPTQDVTVAINVGTGAPNGAVITTPLSVVIPAGTTGPITFDVGAINDVAPDGPVTDNLTITVSSIDLNYDDTSNGNGGTATYSAGGVVGNVVTATVLDNDQTVFLSPNNLSITEGGATGTVTISLSEPPTSDVTVNVSLSNGAPFGAETTIATSIIPAATTNTVDIVVSAIDDLLVEGLHNDTLTVTVSSLDTRFNDANSAVYSGGAGADNNEVALSITDNDAAGVTISESTLSISEAGLTDTFTVTLDSLPSADVTVNLSYASSGTNGAQTGNVSPSVVIPAGTVGPVTFTISAIDDAVAESSPHTDTITVTVSSSDTNYNDANGVTYSGASGANSNQLTTNIVDNDSPGISIIQSGSDSTISEVGLTDDFVVVLNTVPTADVTITLTPDAQCEINTGTGFLGASTGQTLTFTPTNWNTNQTVTVRAIDDPTPEGAHTCAMSVSAPTSTDPNYNGATVTTTLDSVNIAIPSSFNINVIDNDVPGISFNPVVSTVTEGAMIAVDLSLNTIPTADVTITAITNSQCTITTPQPIVISSGAIGPVTIMIQGVEDNTVEVSQTCEVTYGITSPDTDYNFTNVQNVMVLDAPITAPTPNNQVAPQIDVFDPAISKIGLLLPGQLGIIGERLLWEITVTNPSSVVGTGVIFTDTLRPELQVNNVTTSRGTGSISGQTVTVNIGTVNPGDVINITIDTTVLQSNITVDNTACVTSDSGITKCVTSNSIQTTLITELPATGEQPWWRNWLIGIVVLSVFGVAMVSYRIFNVLKSQK